MTKPRLDPDRPYKPPETHAEYVKRLAMETRNFLWQVELWTPKLGIADDVVVITARIALENLQQRLQKL